MKQFLEKESDSWNITLLIKVPLHKFKKEFNFRIKSIEKVDGEIILDPILSSSKYIFSIKNNMLGKIMYFNFKFSLKEIQDIKSFTFGFCDEMVSWLPKSIFSVENEFLKTEEYRDFFDLKKDTSVLEDFSVINTPKLDDNNLVAEIESDVVEKILVEQNLNLDSNYQINIMDYDFEKNIVSNLENKNSLTEKIEETNISTSKSKKTKNTEKGNLNKKRNLKK